MTDSERFHAHLSECDKCNRDVNISLCHIGIELLFEAAEDLDERWQGVARMLHEQDILEREANANFEYYKNCEEP